MATREFHPINVLNFVGIILATFAFLFGPWLGRQSGLDLLFTLSDFVFRADPPVGVARQQVIFGLLVALAVLLICQLFSIYCVVVKRWLWGIRMAGSSAVVALALLSVLFFYYEAKTDGVLLTIIGVAIASGTAIMQWRGAPAASAVASAVDAPPEAAPEEIDAIDAFQMKVTEQFYGYVSRSQAFALAVIGIADYENYVMVNGEKNTRDITEGLLDDLAKTYGGSVSVAFSVGAVMVALPGLHKEDIPGLVSNVELRLRMRPAAGSMFTPGGELSLISGAAHYPEDGDNIIELTEAALSAYAEAVIGEAVAA